MANAWGTNPIVLDTAATDSTYDSTHDVLGGGSQYTTGMVLIKAIKVTGTNGQVILLQHSTPDASVDNGSALWGITLETGDLNHYELMPEGFWAYGIYPKTITSGAKVYIFT